MSIPVSGPALRVEQWLRLAMENVVDYAFVFLDREGRVVGWNPAAEGIKGYSTKEIVGQHFARFYPAEDVAKGVPARALESAMLHGRFEGEGWRLKKDGSRFWASVVITALRDEEGHLHGFFKVTRDLTQRKKAVDEIEALHRDVEERLKDANREIEAFSTAIAHDLRAPLRSIVGFAQILEANYGAGLEPEVARRLRIIAGSAEKLETMIDELLEFGRVVGQPLSLGEIDMWALVHEAWSEIEGTSKVAFSVSPLPRAYGDPVMLKHVWTNLLSNAVKYSARVEHPRIDVTGRGEGGATAYGVRDNGVGFDMARAGKLFDIFQRLHNAAEFEGMGVGLATVQRIVKRHRGDIWAQAKVGEGALFEFSLPRREPA